jgi:Thiamine pyrophosphate enzyme, N-terminal TPP binding domain
MKVLEAIAAAIAAEGIDHLFAVMGDANQDIIVELCEKHGLKFVHAHHEGSAVGMADGYARFSGKIGLATTTQGPGYTNATTSMVASVAVGRPRLIARPLQSAGDGRPERTGEAHRRRLGSITPTISTTASAKLFGSSKQRKAHLS